MQNNTIPVVGMGATMYVGSDRYPYTIVEVVNEKTIVVQEDNAKLVEGNTLSEHQKWECTPNKNNPKIVVTRRKFGDWVKRGEPMHCGSGFVLGHRSCYQSPYV